MGNSRFDSSAYTNYRTTHSLETKSREQIFQSRYMAPGLDPAKIQLRESCDSQANPNSTPVIFALDVTGSMGFVAEEIAKNGLQPLMETIYNEQPISDPHIMFMGVGDINSDAAPLQVSQFEAGAIPLIEQLRTLYLEGRGGSNSYESYDLPWYFATHRTSIDSFKLRGKKGFLFGIGDELPPQENLRHEQLTRVFGTDNIPQPGSVKETLTAAEEKYNVFHIIAEEGNYCRHRLNQVRAEWTELLGPNAIFMRDHRTLSAIVNATLQIANGADIFEVIQSSNYAEDLRYAFHNALEQA